MELTRPETGEEKLGSTLSGVCEGCKHRMRCLGASGVTQWESIAQTVSEPEPETGSECSEPGPDPSPTKQIASNKDAPRKTKDMN